jgi:hypothetical protein
MKIEIADGSPINGDLLIVIDESSPSNNAGGVAYVVAAAAMFTVPDVLGGLDNCFRRPVSDRSIGPARDQKPDMRSLM